MLIHALSKHNKASFKAGDCRYFLHFAVLPSLRSLRGVSIQKCFWDTEPLVYGSNITSLTFEQSLLDSESINNVIKNTFDLEHLKFSFDGREMNTAEEIIVDCLLRRVQNTLRSLDIPGDVCAGEIAWDFEEEESVHNLAELEHLEIIRVSNTIFTELVHGDEDEEDDYDHGENKKVNEDESGDHVQGLTRWTRPLVECLPRSVVSLSLTLPVRKGEASQMLEGLAGRRKKFPKLKEITFEDSNDLDEWTERMRKGGHFDQALEKGSARRLWEYLMPITGVWSVVLSWFGLDRRKRCMDMIISMQNLWLLMRS